MNLFDIYTNIDILVKLINNHYNDEKKKDTEKEKKKYIFELINLAKSIKTTKKLKSLVVKNNFYDILYIIIFNNDIISMKILLEYILIDLNYQSKDNIPLIMLAADRCNIDMVNLLFIYDEIPFLYDNNKLNLIQMLKKDFKHHKKKIDLVETYINLYKLIRFI